ncbi:MAG TPA: hypothetical protein VIV58_33815 [Kofleriaceae bacterium]
MRSWFVLLLGACGSTAGGPDLEITTSFPITTFLGSNPSPLDPLMNGTVAVDVVWQMPETSIGDGNDPPGCASRGWYGPSTTAASGPDADIVTTQLLDRLPDWDVTFQLCTGGGSSVQIVATIDALNLAFECFGIPASANAVAADGHPDLTSFTATMCQATILDVVNNRTLGANDFSVAIHTGPARLN